jgi:hypothetical protein
MRKIILSCVLLPFFFSCKKSSSSGDSTCTLSVAAIAGTYKLTSLRYKPNGGTESEAIGALNTCQLDDLLIFNANGTYTYQDAGISCSPNGTYPGDWTLSGNTLTMEAISSTVQSFSCTTLTYYTLNIPNPGDRYTFKYTRQ